MSPKDEQIRIAIAEQASEWLVSNDEGPLRTQEAAELTSWLKTSPVHVEEFLGVAAVARDLRALGADPSYSLDTLIERARADEESAQVESLRPTAPTTIEEESPLRRWYSIAAVAALVGLLGLGVVLWNLRPNTRVSGPAEMTALHFETQHGEQRTYRLADNSLLHLNTETAVTVRYSQAERLVVLTAGEAAFEVAHEPKRVFRVRAGSIDITDVGTRFDVRLKSDSTVVTVSAGRVVVEAPALRPKGGTASGQDSHHRPLELSANQQISVEEGEWPGTPVAVDAESTTAWMHRQIVFDHEPLERVAAEFNRYAPKPFEITAPELRTLEVSGIFSTDDTEEFLAFLRSLEGVRVEVTATRIRVSQK
jgi:transmembrane sensor